jgi:hypothetical protein
MGMFDYFKCELEFPQPENIQLSQDMVFQTKDFDRLMWTYVLGDDGKIRVEKFDMVEVPEEKRPYYGTPKWDMKGGIYRIIGCLTHVNERTEGVDIGTKMVYFYNIVSVKRRRDTYIEYTAQFVNGILKKISLNKVTDILGGPELHDGGTRPAEALRE